jgi:hypothetical protein
MTYAEDAWDISAKAQALYENLDGYTVKLDMLESDNSTLEAQVSGLKATIRGFSTRLSEIADDLAAAAPEYAPDTPDTAPPPPPPPTAPDPYFARTSPNMVVPLSDWTRVRGAVYNDFDKTLSLPGPSGPNLGNPQSVSPWMAVTPGITYTLSYEMKVDSLHSKGIFSATRVLYANGKADNEGGGSLAMASKSGDWQEVTWFFTAGPEHGAIAMFTDLFVEGPSSGDVLIRNPYVGVGRSFTKAQSAKVPFRGDGTVEIREDGTWFLKQLPFFFKGMYCDPQRQDWGQIGRAGWNVNMWADSVEHVQRAANAGMYSMIQMSTYTDDPGKWGTLARWDLLKNLVQNIKDAGLWTWVLAANLDNENAFERLENCWDAYDVWQSVAGDRPFETLNGNYNVARAFPGDVTGTYVEFSDGTTGQTGGAAGAAGGLTVLENLEGNTIPVSLAQINYGISGPAFRPTMIAKIDEGARSIGFFADGTDAPPIETQPWWDTSRADLDAAEAHWRTKL